MTLWMLWSILFAATLGIAALAIDRVAGGFARPRRHVWMLALLASAVVPVVLALRRADAPPAGPDEAIVHLPADNGTVEIPIVTGSAAPGAVAPVQPVRRFSVDPAAVDRVALVLWIAASSLLALVFGRSMLYLRRRRRAWVDTTLGGQRVLLSTGEGPAVIGFARPSIVVPRWALALDAHAREMMLRHESEHIRAGDPRVLFAAGLLLVAFPWNAGIWWLVHRLRMAMELDCDARVIRSVGASREYALMLLEIGERHTTGLPLSSTLASGRPLLERRIDAMSSSRPRRPLRAALPFLAIALLATTAAARAPRPTSLRPHSIAGQPPTAAAPAAQPAQPTARASQPAAAAQPARPTASPAPTRATATPVTGTARSAPVSASPAAAPARPTNPAQPRKPDRARIAALAREYASDVVRGDTAADYMVLLVNSADQYVWSTHGVGMVNIAVAGDTRTAEERAEFNSLNRAEYMGALAAARGRGGRAGGAATGAGAAGGGGRGGRARGGVVVSDSLRQFIRHPDSLMLVLDSGHVVRRQMGDTTIALGDRYRLMLSDSSARRQQVAGRGGRGGVRGAAGGGDSALTGTVAERRVVSAGRGGRGGAAPDSAFRDVAVALQERARLEQLTLVTPEGGYMIRGGLSRPGQTPNTAFGLEQPVDGRSGIDGIAASAVAFTETYTFAAGELAPAMLRIIVVHLTAGTSFKAPD